MLIFLIIACGSGVILFFRMIRLKKERVEKKKIMEQRLAHLILTNKEKSQ